MNRNEIIRNLEALTAREVRGDLELFKFFYGEKPVVPLNLENIKNFSFWDNGQSVLIYEGRQCLYDCNYEIVYGLKRLTTCYSKDGLVAEFKNY